MNEVSSDLQECRLLEKKQLGFKESTKPDKCSLSWIIISDHIA